MSNWLVTGGAGYIGAHVVRVLKENGITPVALDNLWSGFEKFIPEGIKFVNADIRDTEALTNTLIDEDVVGVIHVAGYKYAGESVKNPLLCYSNNVQGTASVLQAMETAAVKNIVFSSSASVYGTPDVELVTEDAALHPESPYGESKLIGEWLMADMARAKGFKATSLRYFNVCGSGYPDIYDASPYNLFPIVIRMLRAGKTPAINGDDYPTPDGTCVRDYVHVQDLAVSHVAAAKALESGAELLPAYNLGSGDGLSVRDIMDTFREVSGIDFTPTINPRRPGDPARIVADGTAAARDLDWKMRHSVKQMVESAWEAGE
ncbi:MAG: UDP-glucose 4-epimerase GalE [Propionibacteriaceae bacterium]|jgi:UDP-glucose 4-epimerase|nr:UDP-glucose 4-epimerase GalE [Propionibacteriaceae bacterium]